MFKTKNLNFLKFLLFKIFLSKIILIMTEKDQRQEEDDDEYVVCKVVLVGEASVGKTSIINRYVNGKFEEKYQATMCGGKLEKTDAENKVKFSIWDTLGQEKYRSLAKEFYREADVCVIVYDVTNENSFESVQNYWFNDVKDSAPKDAILCLVGNKTDLFEVQRVEEEKARKLAEDNEAIFCLTSAKNDSGIKDLFKKIAEKIEEQGKQGNQGKIKLEDNKDNKGEVKSKKCC